jgi:hypothetical protein
MNRYVHFGASLTTGQGLEQGECYTEVLSTLTGCPSTVVAEPGASNLQILHDILDFDFKSGDCAVLMWVPVNRDLLFDSTGNQTVGSWQSTELSRNWILTHTEHDLSVRTWYHIHHAQQYLQNQGIQYLNIASYTRPLEPYRPRYFHDLELLDSNIAQYKALHGLTSDGHPGAGAHRLLAERILELTKLL